MFNKLMKKVTTEENAKKDFKKLANYVMTAKGHRTTNGFAADCKTNADYLANILNAKINSYPDIKFLKIIADTSEGRVSLKDLTLACGYSNYVNNDMEQIKNIEVRRGTFCYVGLGDVIDSEYGGNRLCLVIQNDVGNHFSSTSIILPLTSRKSKAKLPTHVEAKNCGLPQESIISCEQIRCVSKRRLSQNGIVQKVSECPSEIMLLVEVAMLKAQGVIHLKMNEQEAVQYLMNMNKQKTFQYQNNYNRSASQHVAFA